MAYKKFEASIHLDNFLMHSCQMADPLNKYKKEASKISGKRKKTDEDHEQLALIEYRASLYLNNNNELVIPSRMVEAFLVAASKIHKEGKLSASGLFVDKDAVISYDGGPLTIENLMKSEKHKLVVPVVVQRARIMRTRPYFENVKATIICSLNDQICEEDHLSRWFESGLSTVGMGDWRPRYGRGKLLSLKKIS